MATKKFSPAQIAAQKLFAERARAGTLNQRKKRKPNPGLYENIDAKRKRIAAGSGEKMRKPGQAGRPTAKAFEQSAMTAKRNPDSMSVANTILAQLGGNRFTAMTGAKNFIGGSMFLGFEIGKNSSPANRVTITYSQARDLYSMTFLKAKRGGLDTVELKRFDNVYADQLRSVFTEYTGLETSLGTMGRKTNPDKSKPRAYVMRASQATGRPPVKGTKAGNRLITRRKKALSAPAGYFPNPKVKYTNRAKDLKGEQRVGYSVHRADAPSYLAIAWFSKKSDAVQVAQEASDRTGKQLAVTRVQNYFGPV